MTCSRLLLVGQRLSGLVLDICPPVHDNHGLDVVYSGRGQELTYLILDIGLTFHDLADAFHDLADAFYDLADAIGNLLLVA